jgi:hypothetical protein
MQKYIYWLILFILISGCSNQSSVPVLPEEEASLFTDADIDHAEIFVATQVGKLEGRNTGQVPLGKTLPA